MIHFYVYCLDALCCFAVAVIVWVVSFLVNKLGGVSLRCAEVRLVVDQLNVNPHCPPLLSYTELH